MQALFLVCAGLGTLVLVAQILLGLAGIAGDLPDALEIGEAGMDDGLDLLSVRTLSAATAVFGVSGLALAALGVPGPLALLLALFPGAGAGVGTAYLTRQMLRLESDGSLRLDDAVGAQGQAYLPIPAGRGGVGMVQFPLQGRTVELRAVTAEGSAIPAGAPVVVVAVVDADTVEVMLTPTIEGIDR